MLDSQQINEIKTRLTQLARYWVVIYGSLVHENHVPGRSDVDVAIITRSNDRESNLVTWREALGMMPRYFDVRVFELLPLHVKINIIKAYEVIFGDPLGISEYFYQFRKTWREMAKRYDENRFTSVKDKMAAMAACERIKSSRGLHP